MKSKVGSSFKSQFQLASHALQAELAARHVAPDLSDAIIASGYLLMGGSAFGMPGLDKVVFDGFYGGKFGYGLMPVEEFIEFAKQCADHINDGYPTYHVRSLDEILRILDEPRHRQHRAKMSFRGQTKEYSITRPFPHPVKRRKDRNELLIIPSYWRRFIEDIQSRPIAVPSPILTTALADPLIYDGVPDWQALLVLERINSYSVYGRPASNYDKMMEFKRRYERHKVIANSTDEPYILEQHYGFESIGLDVTFDLKTALFFATNRFVHVDRSRNLADYSPVGNAEHQGVVYCFVFTDPSLVSAKGRIIDLNIFDHCPPSRPVIQQCALPAFGPWNFNEAATELDAVFYLSHDFAVSPMPSKEQLFPGREEDRFYRLLLEQKWHHPAEWGQVVEYAFA